MPIDIDQFNFTDGELRKTRDFRTGETPVPP
jgi:hypothetical protein